MRYPKSGFCILIFLSIIFSLKHALRPVSTGLKWRWGWVMRMDVAAQASVSMAPQPPPLPPQCFALFVELTDKIVLPFVFAGHLDASEYSGSSSRYGWASFPEEICPLSPAQTIAYVCTPAYCWGFYFYGLGKRWNCFVGWFEWFGFLGNRVVKIGLVAFWKFSPWSHFNGKFGHKVFNGLPPRPKKKVSKSHAWKDKKSAIFVQSVVANFESPKLYLISNIDPESNFTL